MAQKPRNIIVLIADSLRYDSVFDHGVNLPYAQEHGVTFTEARSAGCWTLPATASIFTGLMPHEHGATSQSRAIHLDIPTLAEQMKAAGYSTHQITANIATTDIFGLHRGFDEVKRIWQFVSPEFNRLQRLLVIAGKPRIRQKLISKDALMNSMTSDLEMATTWCQHTYPDVFQHCRDTIKANEAKGKPSFIFLNLMETHFPYHIAPTFKLSQGGIYNKLRQIISMFHFLNQTFLKKDGEHIKRDMLNMLKKRQADAWLAISNGVNDFLQEMHQDTGNLVVFGSDHGENFGENGWTYHFSNVTDAGNKVPMFWMDHNGTSPRVEDRRVSTRHLYNSILHAVGLPKAGPSMVHDSDDSHPIMQSFWYNNHGGTMSKYKYNQICFMVDEARYLWR
ncbi:MAG: sulfatase-like hydrolase/transferase, partial [Bacteroidota bacterium]